MPLASYGTLAGNNNELTSPENSNLAPSHFHVWLLKKFLGGQGVGCFDGIQAIARCWDKCISVAGNYREANSVFTPLITVLFFQS